MAMVSVKVCDECKDVTKEASRWVVQESSGDRVTLDLCEEHSVDLREFMARHKPALKKSRKRAAAARSSRKVTSLEEIEAMKK